MAVVITRTSSNLGGTIGTPAAPLALAAASPATGILDLTAVAGVVEATIGGELQIGATAPTTSPTVQFFYSLDGTNYLQDGGTVTLTVVASTNYDIGPYSPPKAAFGAKVVVTNGATTGINVWAQGSTLAVS